MTISLLPDELRRKEEVEKQKAKNARLLPKFKMYVPEKQKESTPNRAPVQPEKMKTIEVKPTEPVLSKPSFNAPSRQFVSTETLPKKIFEQKKEQLDKPSSTMSFHRPEISITNNNLISEEARRPVSPSGERRSSWPTTPLEKSKVESPVEIKPFSRELKKEISNFVKPSPIVEPINKDKLIVPVAKKVATPVSLIDKKYISETRNKFWRNVKFLMIILIAIVVVLSCCFVAIKFYTTEQIKKYNELGQALVNIQPNQVLVGTESSLANFSKERMAALQMLLDKHVYWTKFFDFLEHRTTPTVNYTDFVAGDKGEIVLMARGKSYSDVAAQLFLFQTSELIAAADVDTMQMATHKVNNQEVQEVAFRVKLRLQDNSLMK